MAKLTVLGILVVVGLLFSAVAVAAETDVAEWAEVNIPAEGKAGGWGLAPDSDLSRLSLAAGAIYVNKLDGESRLMRSEDGGISWAETDYEGEAVVDIVCPRHDTETIYLTDGRHVYKSDDGEGFELVSESTLPDFDATNERIACLDIGYDGNHPIIFIGTVDSVPTQYGGVYYLAEGDFGAGWTDMMAEGYDIYAIACPPGFDHSLRLVVLASDENHSYIINNDGVIGGWSERTELLEDNTTSFALSSASRIVFPSDFGILYELFVGVSADDKTNGGVYRVRQGGARDLGPDADIISLDIAEDDDRGLVAGGSQGQLWYSPDAGESWLPSQKAPTGDGAVYVATDSSHSGVAYAATSDTESAFSVSRDGGLTWNQLSLIDTQIIQIIDLAPSPSDDTMFMLTHSDGEEHSLWRHRGGAWERVYGTSLPDVDTLERVALCPQYDADNRVVLLAGTGDGSPSIWKSTDDGQSFNRRRTPLPVDAWVVIDNSTWFIGGYDGSNGRLYHVTNSGLSYSLGTIVGEESLNSIALSPDYSQDETILVGNKDGWVYWSQDNGKSFDPLGEPLPELITEATALNEITVAFDPGYSHNNTVYAASHCQDNLNHSSAIYRFIIGKSDDWKAIDSLAEGAVNALIVSAEGTLYAANFAADGGIERCLNPGYPLQPAFESITRGLDEGAELVGLWLQGQKLLSIDSIHTSLLSYNDGLTTPVTLLSPSDGAPGVGMLVEDKVINVSLDWETLPGATAYRWQLNYETDFSSLPEGFEGTTQGSSVHLVDLSPTTTYYWRVRAIEPTLGPWSERWSFTTSLGQTVTAPSLRSPGSGATGVPIEPIFQWSAIAGADSYELIISTFATLDNPTILKTDGYALPATAWQCNISLNYDTTYYWKVRAVSADSCSAWSSVSAFSTESAPSNPAGTVAEAPTPTPEPENPEWLDWLMPVGGIVLLVFLVVMITMVIVMVLLVIKVSKL
jgi:photosystem II stability/assembly factor-like uncharacterized protein